MRQLIVRYISENVYIVYLYVYVLRHISGIDITPIIMHVCTNDIILLAHIILIGGD